MISKIEISALKDYLETNEESEPRIVKGFLEDVISMFDELQQYKAIGTVGQCWEAKERQIRKKLIYNSNGGVDKDWICPACGKFCNPYSKFCQNCGQAII